MVTLPAMRRIGVENYTPEDFTEEARRNKANQEVHDARMKVMLERGWEFRRSYIKPGPSGLLDEMGDELVADDPITGEEVKYEAAFKIQEGREPGSLPPWPTFDNDWKPPPSKEFDVPSFVMDERKPMTYPSMGEILDRERLRAAEDDRLFTVLDSLGASDAVDKH